MRYGVISDIHSNIEALEAVLLRLEQEQVEQYLFCGDLIGYGPDPQACVQRYQQLSQVKKVQGVAGNHDAIVLHPELQEYFHFEALQVLEWSVKVLSKESLRCVSFLPEIAHGDGFTIVHGTPRDPLKEYFFNSLQYRALYEKWVGQILFVGHTHMPFCMKGNAQTCKVFSAAENTTIQLDPSQRYVINPGSVGRPRDNDVRAAFGVWDTQAKTFTFLRVPYDYQKTQRKMIEFGLPRTLIEGFVLGL